MKEFIHNDLIYLDKDYKHLSGVKNKNIKTAIMHPNTTIIDEFTFFEYF